MSEIIRNEVSEDMALSGIVEAGDFVFLSFLYRKCWTVSRKPS